MSFKKKYRFTIAFENDSVPNYSTEKLTDAFAAKTIPIYWGDPNIALHFNTDSFINCHDYDTFDDVVARVIEIDSNPELYESILSQPIFKNEVVPKEYTYEYLEEYLYYIFDQPIEKAKRISNYTFKVYYEGNLKKTVESYNRIGNAISGKQIGKLYYFFKKLF